MFDDQDRRPGPVSGRRDAGKGTAARMVVPQPGSRVDLHRSTEMLRPGRPSRSARRQARARVRSRPATRPGGAVRWRRTRLRRPGSAAPPRSAPYTSPTRAVRASACATMFAMACWASPNSSSTTSVGRVRGGPATTNRMSSPVLRAHATCVWIACSMVGPAGRRAADPVRCAGFRSARSARPAGPAPGGRGRARPGQRIRAGRRVCALPRCSTTEASALDTESWTSRTTRSRSSPVASARGQLGRLRVHPRVDHGERGMPGEELQQGDVRRLEPSVRVAAEHDAGADHRARPADRAPRWWRAGPPDRTGRCARPGRGVLGEGHRAAGPQDLAGHPLGQRELVAGPAGDAEIDLLAVGPRPLVDRADRAAVRSRAGPTACRRIRSSSGRSSNCPARSSTTPARASSWARATSR